jgi:hypothetical protein
MDGDRYGRQGRSYDSAHAPSQIAAEETEPVDDTLGWCILLPVQDSADVGAYFASRTNGLPPFVGERFQAGHTLREDNPAIRFFRRPRTRDPAMRRLSRSGDHKLGAPQLKTRRPAYIERQLAAFAQGFRQNDINEQMRTIAMQLTPDEMHLIAEFYGAGAAGAQVAGR